MKRKNIKNMGDLDVNLIKEFARRPAFYDRSNIHFKDKQWNQKAWLEISHLLGYEVHLLKDRMLQLRNRYNLEKRRLENLRLENPNKAVRSPWPLFHHLRFLDSHIRPRRSYKSMMSRSKFEDTFNGFEASIVRSGDDYECDEEDKQPEIKYETELDSEEDRQTSNNEEIGDNNIPDEDDVQDNPISVSHSNNSTAIYPARLRCSSSGLISVRDVDAMKRDCKFSDDIQTNPLKKRKVCRPEKFEAFGKFLTLSLCDLPEDKALLLIEKFTSDLVKATLESHFSKDNFQNDSFSNVSQHQKNKKCNSNENNENSD